MADTLSLLGPNCDCDCDPKPPPTEGITNKRCGRWIYQAGLPPFRPHSKTLVVDYVIGYWPPASTDPSGTLLVVNSGAQNGVWQRSGGANTRKGGYGTAATLTNICIVALFRIVGDQMVDDQTLWWQNTANPTGFGDLTFDNQRAGQYSGIFARYAGMYGVNSQGGPWLVNTNYSGRFGYLAGEVCVYGDAAGTAGQAMVAAQDGAGQLPLAYYGWAPFSGSTSGSRLRYRQDLGAIVPLNFLPGEFCRDNVETGGVDFTCISGITTHTGGGPTGSSTRPGQDAAHWKKASLIRCLPFDGFRPVLEQSTNSAAKRYQACRRFQRMIETTTVEGPTGTATGSRVWQWDAKDKGLSREAVRYRLVSYQPLPDYALPFGNAWADSPFFEFPSWPYGHDTFDTRFPVSSVYQDLSYATETEWVMVYDVVVRDKNRFGDIRTDRYTVTQRVTLEDEFTHADIMSTLLDWVGSVFPPMLMGQTQAMSHWSDGSMANLVPPGAMGNDVFVPFWMAPNDGTKSFAGFTDDMLYFAGAVRYEFCHLPKPYPATTGQPISCVQLIEDKYYPQNQKSTATYLENCLLAGPLAFEHLPDPANVTGWHYAESGVPAPCGTAP